MDERERGERGNLAGVEEGSFLSLSESHPSLKSSTRILPPIVFRRKREREERYISRTAPTSQSLLSSIKLLLKLP